MNNLYCLIKKSFSLIEVSIYLAIVGILTITAITGKELYEEAKMQKVIEDLQFYENGMLEFVKRYGAWPGAITKQRCLKFPEFSQYCLTANVGDATGSGSGVNARITCLRSDDNNTIINRFVKAPLHLASNVGGLINIINYGRYLKTSDIMPKRVKLGLDSDFNETIKENWFSTKSNDMNYFLPKVEGVDDTYMLYLYGTSNHGWLTQSRGCNTCMGAYSFANPINATSCMFQSHGYLLILFTTMYKRDGFHAFSAKMMHDIDVKIDDGLPRNGKIIGYGEKIGDCDDGTAYYPASNASSIEQNKNISYLDTKDREKGCQLVYQPSIKYSGYLY